jgi:MFS family permease
MGLWLSLLTVAGMALSTWMPNWALWRYLGGLCGATGMLLGAGLVLGWLMRQGRRPELGVHFIGLGLGIVVSVLGAWGVTQVWVQWSSKWLAMAAIGLLFLYPHGFGGLRCRPRQPLQLRHRPPPQCLVVGC